MFPQNSKNISGKYCEDLGFGWYCIDFRKNGKCKISSGHSYWKNTIRGKWFFRNDTLISTSRAIKKREINTFYFVIESDTIYSVYVNNKDKQIERGTALIKK